MIVFLLYYFRNIFQSCELKTMLRPNLLMKYEKLGSSGMYRQNVRKNIIKLNKSYN